MLHQQIRDTPAGVEVQITAQEAVAEEAVTQVELGNVLAEELRNEANRFRRNVVRTAIGVSAYGVLVLCVKYLLGKERWDTLIPVHLLVYSAFTAGGLATLVAVHSITRPRARRRALTARVAGQKDVRAIGPLIDALGMDDSKTRQIATGALTALLPKATLRDAVALTASQWLKLSQVLLVPIENPLYKDVRALFRPAETAAVDFRVAILQALVRVGDARTLPAVKHWASRRPGTPGERRIHEAAKTCLPFLTQRIEQMTSNRTLLRSSQPSTDAGTTLLRSAEENHEHVTESLLRPSTTSTEQP